MNNTIESYIKSEKFSYNKSIKIIDNLNKNSNGQIKAEIVKGLLSSPKYISSKFFYDSKGSRLFEEITKLEEYYPTRTEKSILNSIGDKLNLDFKYLNIIELGSGDHTKIRLLLKQIPESIISTVSYYPIDISRSAITKASQNLMKEFPTLKIIGILTDFMNSFELPKFNNNSLFCFLGSTIGNLIPNEAEIFLKKFAQGMNSGDRLLLGLDMVKDVSVLNMAYNDRQNITAEFNKNIIDVVNSLISTNICADDFQHIAFYNEEEQRIEMHLKSLKNMTIKVKDSNKKIKINKDELINTEYSYKFTSNDINRLSNYSGLKIENIFTTKNQWFSLVEFRK